jgi:hypothetical protein
MSFFACFLLFFRFEDYPHGYLLKISRWSTRISSFDWYFDLPH